MSEGNSRLYFAIYKEDRVQFSKSGKSSSLWDFDMVGRVMSNIEIDEVARIARERNAEVVALYYKGTRRLREMNVRQWGRNQYLLLRSNKEGVIPRGAMEFEDCAKRRGPFGMINLIRDVSEHLIY